MTGATMTVSVGEVEKIGICNLELQRPRVVLRPIYRQQRVVPAAPGVGRQIFLAVLDQLALHRIGRADEILPRLGRGVSGD